MISSNIKTLDLHGETTDIARVLVNEFIEDCHKLEIQEAIIIHGIGSGKIKNEVHKTLKNKNKIKKY